MPASTALVAAYIDTWSKSATSRCPPFACTRPPRLKCTGRRRLQEPHRQRENEAGHEGIARTRGRAQRQAGR